MLNTIKALNFSLQDQTGTVRMLREYSGKRVVMYFYPKDCTPGYTTEACNFRVGESGIADFGNAVVIGVNKDFVTSHTKFAEKHNLNFTLLSDESTTMIDAYGAWQEKSMYGRKYIGIQRMMVIINPQGEIVKTYPKVSPKDHAVEIINDLKKLQLGRFSPFCPESDMAETRVET